MLAARIENVKEALNVDLIVESTAPAVENASKEKDNLREKNSLKDISKETELDQQAIDTLISENNFKIININDDGWELDLPTNRLLPLITPTTARVDPTITSKQIKAFKHKVSQLQSIPDRKVISTIVIEEMISDLSRLTMLIKDIQTTNDCKLKVERIINETVTDKQLQQISTELSELDVLHHP